MLSDSEIQEGIRLGEQNHRVFRFDVMAYSGTGNAAYCHPFMGGKDPDVVVKEKEYLQHAANNYTTALYELQQARAELNRLRGLVEEIKWKVSQ